MEPLQDLFLQRLCKLDQFVGVRCRRIADTVVFNSVSLGSAGIQIVGIGLTGLTKDQGQRLQSSVMRECLRWAIALGIKQNRAKFECRVVGDAKSPVVGNLGDSHVGKIATHDRQQIADFLSACLMWLQPTVIQPLF